LFSISYNAATFVDNCEKSFSLHLRPPIWAYCLSILKDDANVMIDINRPYRAPMKFVSLFIHFIQL